MKIDCDEVVERLIAIESRLGVIESRIDRIDNDGFEERIYDDIREIKENSISKWESRGLFAIIMTVITILATII